MATLLAGVILVAFGLARLGAAIKFIPYPVTIGFTSGIALIILSGEVKDFLGLKMGPVPAEFVRAGGRSWRISTRLILGGGRRAVTVAIIVAWPRISRRIPSPFVALIVTTAARAALAPAPSTPSAAGSG